MKCQNCDDAEATIHFKEVVDGDLREIHLCEACAAEKGFHLVLEQNKLSIATQFIWMAENLYPESSAKVGAVRCAECGLRYSQFTRTGRLGCPECYRAFDAQLQQILRRVHGATRHKGGSPRRARATTATALRPEKPSTDQVAKKKLESLKQELNRAVEREDFEKAAGLRDEIRRLETGPPPAGEDAS
jgi:protein arginine kinase activator